MQPKTEYIEFALTEPELNARKDKLLRELDTNDRLNVEAKEAAARYKSQITSSDTNITKLRNSIKDAREMIECEITFNDPADGKKTIKRLDNNFRSVVDMTTDEKEAHNQDDMFEKEA